MLGVVCMTKRSTNVANPVAQLKGLAEGLWPEEVSSVELIRGLRRRAEFEFTNELRCYPCFDTKTGQEVKDK